MSELKIVKILYIDEDLDERGASAHLEKITKHLSLTCIFTVMQNALSALESMEFVSYDLCFIADNMDEKCSMGAFEFLRVVKIIGGTLPVVLLISDATDQEQDGLPPIGYHNCNPTAVRFASTLVRPYTRSELCMTICHAFTAPSPKGRSLGNELVPMPTQTLSKNLISPIPFSPTRTNSSGGAALLQDITHQSHSLSNLSAPSKSIHVWGMQEMSLDDRSNQNNYLLQLPTYPVSYVNSYEQNASTNSLHSQYNYGGYTGKRVYNDIRQDDSAFENVRQTASFHGSQLSAQKKAKVGSY